MTSINRLFNYIH